MLGVEVSAINPGMAIQRISEWIDAGHKEYVCVTGVHGVIESQKDSELMSIHNSAGLVTPDGMPLVWCGRFAGARWMQRVYGPDLVLEVCRVSQGKGWRHFFYGAGPGVAEELASNLEKVFPGVDIAGTYSPPFRELAANEVDDIAQMINAAKPDIVWVGLSTPKQERWMSRFRSQLAAPVLIGVGAAFDMHAGNLRQAPKWMQGAGLEWLFRLGAEPKRLWRRYLSIVPGFLVRIARNPPHLVELTGGSKVRREPGRPA